MIWSIIAGSRVFRAVAWALGLAVAVLTFGAYKRRQGASDERLRRQVKDMVADQKAHERINDADLGIGATDAERISRLRDFATKHGNGSSKAGGG
jgi:hypothetical protein